MSEIQPTYYRGADGKDLFDRFEAGLLTADEVRGFYKGNVFKYVTRYQAKNGTDDLDKAITYLQELKDFEKTKQPASQSEGIYQFKKPDLSEYGYGDTSTATEVKHDD